VTTHVPVPLVIFTVVPLSVQTPETPTLTVNPELDDALTPNVVLYTAVNGTPVTVIVWLANSAVTSTTSVAGL